MPKSSKAQTQPPKSAEIQHAHPPLRLGSLLLFTFLQTIFFAVLAFLFAVAGFLVLPPWSGLVCTLLFAMVMFPLGRLFLLAGNTYSVAAARLAMTVSALLAGWFHALSVMALRETLGGETIALIDLLDHLTDVGTQLFGNYFLRPFALWESFLYYNDGWLMLLLAALYLPLATVQFTLGGVRRRRANLSAGIDEDEEI